MVGGADFFSFSCLSASCFFCIASRTSSPFLALSSFALVLSSTVLVTIVCEG